MAYDLGSARGDIRIGVAAALASLVALRRSSYATIGTLNTLGRAAIVAGTGLLGVGAGIAAVFAVAVRKTAELESRLSYFKGVTGANAAEMAVLRQEVIDLGQSSAYTAKEVADGFIELGKAGANTKQIIGGMGEAVITLGQSADISLDKAAKFIVGMSSTFGIGAGEASKVADIIQGAANSSIIEVQDLAVTMKYAGGVAASLGLSLKETATAAALLGNAGIKGSTAGTSLRRIMLQLTPRTDKAAAALEQLGIITEDGANKFYKANGDAKSFSEITEILYQSTKNLTAEMKQKALATIFGDRAINSAIILAKGGAKAFDEMYKQVGNVRAADVAAERLNNLAGAWEIFKGSIDSALISAGTPAQEPLKQLVQTLTKMVNVFTDLNPETQKMIVKFALAFAALSLLSGVFLITVGTMLRAWAVVRQLSGGFAILARFIGTTLIPVLFRLGAALFANPVGLLVLAVAALIGGLTVLYFRSERFRKAVNSIGQTIWKIVKPAFEWMYNFAKDNLAAAFKLMSDSFERIKVRIVRALKALNKALGGSGEEMDKVAKIGKILAIVLGVAIFGPIIAIVGAFTLLVVAIAWIAAGFVWLLDKALELGEYLGGKLIGAVKAIIGWFQDLPDRIEAAGDKIGEFFTKLPGRVRAGLAIALAAIGRFFVMLGGKILSFFTGAGSMFLDFFTNLPGKIGFALGFVLGVIVRALYEIGAAILRFLFSGGKMLLDFFINLPGTIGRYLVVAVVTVGRLFAQMAIGAYKGAQKLFVAVALWLGRLPGMVGRFLLDTLGKIGNFIRRAPGNAGQAAQSIYTAMRTWFSKLPGMLGGFLTGVLNRLVNMGQSAFTAALGFGKWAYDGLMEWIGKIPDAVWGALGAAIKAFLSLIKKAYNSAKNFAKGLWEGFKAGLGINSPSYIEEAMFSLNDNVRGEMRTLEKSVAKIQKIGNTLPSMNASLVTSGAAGRPSRASGAIPDQRSGAGGDQLSIGQIIIPADDIQQMKDIGDFFAKVKQTARAKGGS